MKREIKGWVTKSKENSNVSKEMIVVQDLRSKDQFVGQHAVEMGKSHAIQQ